MGNLSLPSNGDAALPTSRPNIAEATGKCPMGCTVAEATCPMWCTASGVEAVATTIAQVKTSVIPSSGVCPYGHGSVCPYGHGSK